MGPGEYVTRAREQLLLELLAQFHLEDLAGRVARQRRDDLEPARQLVARQLRAGELAQSLEVEALPGPEHGDRANRLAPLLVGHTDHGGLGDRRMLVDDEI